MGKKVFFLLFLISFLLNAHPPKSIDLSYDAAKDLLAVKVWHKVGNPEGHYIEKIVVFLGDEQIAEKIYQRQQTDKYQEEIFVFSTTPLKKGDLVKVRATCSKFGRKTVLLKWPE
jgi:hypothetical protein